MNHNSSPFPLIDNPVAPDTYADQVTCFQIHQGVMRLTLEKLRLNVHHGTAPATRVVIGTLFMPTEAAEAMAKGMVEFIARNRQPVTDNGAILAAPPDAMIN